MPGRGHGSGRCRPGRTGWGPARGCRLHAWPARSSRARTCGRSARAAVRGDPVRFGAAAYPRYAAQRGRGRPDDLDSAGHRPDGLAGGDSQRRPGGKRAPRGRVRLPAADSTQPAAQRKIRSGTAEQAARQLRQPDTPRTYRVSKCGARLADPHGRCLVIAEIVVIIGIVVAGVEIAVAVVRIRVLAVGLPLIRADAQLCPQPVKVSAAAAVLQLACHLNLLGLGSAAPHWLDPLERTGPARSLITTLDAYCVARPNLSDFVHV